MLINVAVSGEVTVRNPDSGELVGEPFLTPSLVDTRVVAFDTTTRLIAAGGEAYIAIVDRATGQPLLSVENLGTASALSFSPDTTLLAVGNRDGAVYLIATDTGEVLAEVTDTDDTISVLAFSQDGRLLAVAAGIPISSNTITLYSIDLPD